MAQLYSSFSNKQQQIFSMQILANGSRFTEFVYSVYTVVLRYCWLGIWKSIRPVKIEWWGADICLQRCADCLHMVQLMPLHPQTPSTLASFKSRLILPSWYWLTQVVLEKRSLNECSCGISSSSSSSSSCIQCVISGVSAQWLTICKQVGRKKDLNKGGCRIPVRKPLCVGSWLLKICLYLSLCGGGIIQSLLAVEAAGLLNDAVLQLQTTIIYRHYNYFSYSSISWRREKETNFLFCACFLVLDRNWWNSSHILGLRKVDLYATGSRI